MIGKMSALFYRDKVDAGGLALTTEMVADVKGLFGVIGIIGGGLLGGWIVHKLGMKRAFWPVALAMHVPNFMYLAAAYNQQLFAGNVGLLRLLEVVDQMGYGVGYAAYFVYLMTFAAKGNYQTTHYAIASGLGALCISLAGIMGGITQSNFGWTGMFWCVMLLGIPALWTLLIIPVEADSSIKLEMD
jgi:PAT family beta-lactamase induction signal transducer AmpG